MSEAPTPAIARLLHDQRERWARGDCVPVEAYLQRHPSLEADNAGLLDLIYNEVFLRERKGEQPRREEYQRRFPHLAVPIGMQFDVHQAIGAGVAVEDTSTTPTIPGYELLEEIGRGGMGCVYKARHEERNSLVAVKMVHARHVGNRAVRKRFVAEAQAVAALDHPNIVKVFEVSECADGPYFVMELMAGASLEDVRLQGTPEIARTIHWLIPIAEAVHYAHDRGIIHRDLKPANVMLDDADRPKVMDFGMAKIRRKPGDGHISSTKEGVVLGTPGYMPPEQAGAEADAVGPHSDVYSLGAILYALLTGRPPFDEGGFLPTLFKVRSPEPPLPVRSLRSEVPAALEGICHKCLNKNPADRFQTAQELVEALRAFARMPYHSSKAVPVCTTTTAADVPLGLVSLKTGQLISLVKIDTLVGRSPTCDLVLSASDVSRRHCRITRTGGRVFLEDLDSTRGTCVNGSRVKRTQLHNGDRIEIAGQVFQVVAQ
jgi:serine/threonine protein kinase